MWRRPLDLLEQCCTAALPALRQRSLPLARHVYNALIRQLRRVLCSEWRDLDDEVGARGGGDPLQERDGGTSVKRSITGGLPPNTGRPRRQ
jgi:hypothetical protein